ncbi:hypothetical protein EFA69_06255 [Rufibacter immobilis]|uniref:Uncharacterized protein n=1 Tax=Rufibacter immobilis TaxID=1348778 RepID=A0A3M9N1Y3_9BACT|nr:hypothetical protein [Rufibacter immobilis]RNI31800.1 hypothetical protein EFA69_06255 [Rufibacter immobilis]
MTLYQFNSLDQNDKANTVWESGKFIKTVVHCGVYKALYAMGDFFAEIHFSPEDGIKDVQGFKSKTRLLPYKNIGLSLLTVLN